MATAAAHSKAVVLLLFIHCLLLLLLFGGGGGGGGWGCVKALFVMQNFVSFLVLQSSRRGSES